MQPKCYSVIIAGGKGTRFWPLSRSQRPKQLLKILGRRSLISETASRVLSISGRKQTLVVTVAEQLNALRKELRRFPRRIFLAEPYGKNTAPCIGLAALEVVAKNPGAVMVSSTGRSLGCGHQCVSKFHQSQRSKSQCARIVWSPSAFDRTILKPATAIS